MSATYSYFFRETDDFDVGLPLGFEYGEVTEKTDVPVGAQIVSPKELKRLVRAAEQEDSKRVDAAREQD